MLLFSLQKLAWALFGKVRVTNPLGGAWGPCSVLSQLWRCLGRELRCRQHKGLLLDVGFIAPSRASRPVIMPPLPLQRGRWCTRVVSVAGPQVSPSCRHHYHSSTGVVGRGHPPRSSAPPIAITPPTFLMVGLSRIEGRSGAWSLADIPARVPAKHAHPLREQPLTVPAPRL